MLHITSGESVRIHETGLPGDVVYWLDILHEGPVPAGLSLPDMSQVRGRFLTAAGYAPEGATDVLRARDAALARYTGHEETVLWFEHDLYDQLQLIQILDWFLLHERAGRRLSLICIGKFPGIGRFKGLGQLTSEQLFSLFDKRQEVTLADLKYAAEAWAAFSSPDPRDIEEVISIRTDNLPYLKGALQRHLEQFPSVQTGLARTEWQILEAVAAGNHLREEVFLGDQDKEERVFLGDAVFDAYARRMCDCREPLLAWFMDRCEITPAGERVLRGQADAVELNGFSRWLGGVHLKGRQVEWRWDEKQKRLIRKDPARAHRN